MRLETKPVGRFTVRALRGRMPLLVSCVPVRFSVLSLARPDRKREDLSVMRGFCPRHRCCRDCSQISSFTPSSPTPFPQHSSFSSFRKGLHVITNSALRSQLLTSLVVP